MLIIPTITVSTNYSITSYENSRTFNDLEIQIQGLSSTNPVSKYFQGLEYRGKKFKNFQGCVALSLSVTDLGGGCRSDNSSSNSNCSSSSSSSSTHLSLENERFSFRKFVFHLCSTFAGHIDVTQCLTQVAGPLVNTSKIILAAVEIFIEPVLSETHHHYHCHHQYQRLLDPEGGSQKATLVVLVVVSSLKIPTS